MRHATLLIAAFLSVTGLLGTPGALAQSLAGSWTIANTAQNACPGRLQISPSNTQAGGYTGAATFQCGSDPAVVEEFDIAVASGIVSMDGHNASGPWCADHYSLNLQGDNAMSGSSKDGCGVTGKVSLAKLR